MARRRRRAAITRSRGPIWYAKVTAVLGAILAIVGYLATFLGNVTQIQSFFDSQPVADLSLRDTSATSSETWTGAVPGVKLSIAAFAVADNKSNGSAKECRGRLAGANWDKVSVYASINEPGTSEIDHLMRGLRASTDQTFEIDAYARSVSLMFRFDFSFKDPFAFKTVPAYAGQMRIECPGLVSNWAPVQVDWVLLYRGEPVQKGRPLKTSQMGLEIFGHEEQRPLTAQSRGRPRRHYAQQAIADRRQNRSNENLFEILRPKLN